ncbi:MAG: UDP-N-acetylmuramoyl-L-alanine--D-glutamate ligase [Crocinitomicaceae bacterium]|nr:UDP-N-acetylmuramoyl-L-alanine--D-glutamate ligase [Crocinitomicaceae bacterium]
MADVLNIAIIGAGESGVGAAQLAKSKGFDVFVSDFGSIKKKYKSVLEEEHIAFEEGTHDFERILKADCIVKSPGIPDKVPIIQKAKESKIPVISEIEFAAQFTDAKLICVTGSNGKTTTASLIYHIMKKGGLDVVLCGNVGESFAAKVAEGDHDYFVIELSSFQLDGMYKTKPFISVLMNITPDHLDRYDYDFDKYANSKMRITQNLDEHCWFIYNYDDEVIRNKVEAMDLHTNLAPFSLLETEGMAGFRNNKQITININDQLNMSIYDLALKGSHNTQNSLASGIAGRILEIRKESVRESLSDFQNVEHRLEFVASVHGIGFVNDSKATNVNSTWYALESMENRTVWIVGGVDKGNDYSALEEMVAEKVSAIICLGKENQKIIDAFDGIVDTIVEASSATEAVAYGYQLANKGETVLLSPACASFDLFENFEDRGNQFKAAVRAL